MKLIDGSVIADCLDYYIMDHEGWKIGFIGIAEKDWIVTLSEFDPEDIEYQDANVVGEEYGKMLSKRL